MIFLDGKQISVTSQGRNSFSCVLSRIYYFTLVSDKKLSAVRICGRQVEVLIFFWDPLTPVAHDHDVKALLRVASLYNVILATNPKTANIILQELSKFRIG